MRGQQVINIGRKMLKGTANGGSNGDRMKQQKCRVQLVLLPEKMKWISAEFG
jgi:hypothetical protein